MWTAAIMASRRAWPVAWSSPRRASGDAAWMTPNANPHRTGTRTDWPACGEGVGAGMDVMAGASLWRPQGGALDRGPLLSGQVHHHILPRSAINRDAGEYCPAAAGSQAAAFSTPSPPG